MHVGNATVLITKSSEKHMNVYHNGSYLLLPGKNQ